MAKIPENNNKNGMPASQDPSRDLQSAKGTAAPDTNSNQNTDGIYPEIGAYSQNNPMNMAPNLTSKVWEEGKDAYLYESKPWIDDPKKHLAIRAFSRGVLGVAFFAAGGFLTKKWLRDSPYDAAKPFAEQLPGSKDGNILKTIAKIIDTGVGVPLEKTVTALTGDPKRGMEFVRFRPTYYKNYPPVRGRSLGDEATTITTDFFLMSVGDAIGRDIIGWFDPNIKKTWTDDKGNIKFPEALQALGKSWWRYTTYNGGEDWAVAIPYAYYMKFQRGLINRFSPGFMYDSDRNTNGASHKLDDNHQIVGNYNKEGMIDLQGRFTVYNIGTLMYREVYNYIADRIKGKPTSLYGAPTYARESKGGIVGSIVDVAKWLVRSVVKGAVIMTPTVPFFWISRVPQGKYRGWFIHPKKGMLSYETSGDICEAFGARTFGLSGDEPLRFSSYNPYKTSDMKNQFDRVSQGTVGQIFPEMIARTDYPHRNHFDAYAKTFGPTDKFFNEIGRANYKLAGKLDGLAERMDNTRFGRHFTQSLNIPKTEAFTRSFVMSSLTYTPYMYAKAEFSKLWDSGKMDLSVERAIDGVAKMNWGEFKAGVSDTINTILHHPLEDPQREAEAQWRIKVDNSPADVFLDTKGQEIAEKIDADREMRGDFRRWQDRIFAGAPKSARTKANKEKKDFIAAFKPNPQVSGYSDQESMRKLLADLNPPTNSKH